MFAKDWNCSHKFFGRKDHHVYLEVCTRLEGGGEGGDVIEVDCVVEKPLM